MNFVIVLGYFLPILRIHKLVIFIEDKVMLHGILFVD